jgi:hypothetical protein
MIQYHHQGRTCFDPPIPDSATGGRRRCFRSGVGGWDLIGSKHTLSFQHQTSSSLLSSQLIVDLSISYCTWPHGRLNLNIWSISPLRLLRSPLPLHVVFIVQYFDVRQHRATNYSIVWIRCRAPLANGDSGEKTRASYRAKGWTEEVVSKIHTVCVRVDINCVGTMFSLSRRWG